MLESTATTSDASSGRPIDAPPAPPRDLTRRVRRQSWNERRVRVWIILSIMLSLATVGFMIRDVRLALAERMLISSGLKIPATIESIDDFDLRTREFTRDESHALKLRYTTPGGETLFSTQELPMGTGESLHVGQTYDLRVDPDDPTQATIQSTPRPWTAALAVVCLLAPLSLLVISITFLTRRGVLNTWRDGQAAEAIVVDSRRSGIAPKSSVVRFTLAGEDDRRIFSTLYPLSRGELSSGDVLTIVMPRGKPSRALVAELYE